MTNMQKLEIISVLQALPLEKVNEVTDFAKMLRERHGLDPNADISDEWSDEDYVDAARFAMTRGYAGIGDDE